MEKMNKNQEVNPNNIYCVGDLLEIRKGDKLNIGIPEYIVFPNSTSPSYVLTNNIIAIGSILKPEKRYTDDDLFLVITEAIHKASGISPSRNNNLGSSVQRLINDVNKIEKKIIRTFNSSAFIGEWRIDKIEPCRDNGAQCMVKMTKNNSDGSVMHNFIRVFGNERMQFRF